MTTTMTTMARLGLSLLLLTVMALDSSAAATTAAAMGKSTPPPTTPTPLLDVHIVASPTSIHQGFTKYLSINCTFDHSASSDFKTIMSLILSKTAGPNDNNFNEIATITAFSGSKVDVTNTLGAAVDGHMEHLSESYISYEWKYPTTATEGKYRCEAYGMDQRGHPRDMKTVTTVTERAVDMSMVLENMKKMDVELDELLTFKQDITTRLMQSMLALMEKSAQYNGKTYYLSRPMVKNTAVSDSMCRLYGGQLLEIDDQAELNFVGTFVSSQQLNSSITLGASDETHEGTWTSLSTGSPVRFFHWEVTHVNSGPQKNCLYLGDSVTGPAMFDDLCYDLDFSRFICEM